MVEAVLTFIVLFTLFDGVTVIIDELEERRRLNHRLKLLREARRNQ